MFGSYLKHIWRAERKRQCVLQRIKNIRDNCPTRMTGKCKVILTTTTTNIYVRPTRFNVCNFGMRQSTGLKSMDSRSAPYRMSQTSTNLFKTYYGGNTGKRTNIQTEGQTEWSHTPRFHFVCGASRLEMSHSFVIHPAHCCALIAEITVNNNR
jgi:hypothetical protein